MTEATGMAPRGRRSGWTPLWWSLGFSLSMVLAFPPVDLWPAVFLAAPMLFAAGRSGGRLPRRAGLLGALGSLPLWFFEQRWLIDVTAAGYPLLCLYLSLYPGLFVWLVARGSRGGDCSGAETRIRPYFALAAAVIWVGLEVIRGEWVLTGYPWFLTAHPVIAWPPLAAPASLLGTYFVSFLVAATGLLSSEALRARGRGWARPAGMLTSVLGVWAVLALIGWRQSDPATGSWRSIRVGIVQTNIPQTMKLRWDPHQKVRDFERFLLLSRRIVADGAEVVIWPETMFPGMFLDPESVRVLREAGMAWPAKEPGERPVPVAMFARSLVDEQRQLGVPMVIGALAAEGLQTVRGAPERGGGAGIKFDRRFNSAFVVQDGRISEERYDKMHLTPFGEVIPWIWRWPRLQQLALDFGAKGMTFDLAAGSRAEPIRVRIGDATGGVGGGEDTPAEREGHELSLATPICFEATQSELCRRLVYQEGRRGAALLVNLSNDGWFGRFDGGREHHLQSAAWRCAELGTPMVRSVNTGISCVIGARGGVETVLADEQGRRVNVEAAAAVEVALPPAGHSTVFGRLGDIFRWIVAGGLLVVALGWLRGRPALKGSDS